MGERYKQLSLEERCTIAELHRAGRSNGQIATALDRSTSSIGRELKRNAGKGPRAAPYRPAFAQAQAQARRWSGARLERNEALRDQVLGLLAQGWSPEQVAGRLRLENGGKRGCQIVCVSGAVDPILERKGFDDDYDQA